MAVAGKILMGGKLVPQSEGGGELRYSSPPPSYSCIRGPESISQGVVHNLMDFIVMLPSGNGKGEVHTLQSVNIFFNASVCVQKEVEYEDEVMQRRASNTDE